MESQHCAVYAALFYNLCTTPITKYVVCSTVCLQTIQSAKRTARQPSCMQTIQFSDNSVCKLFDHLICAAQRIHLCRPFGLSERQQVRDPASPPPHKLSAQRIPKLTVAVVYTKAIAALAQICDFQFFLGGNLPSHIPTL